MFWLKLLISVSICIAMDRVDLRTVVHMSTADLMQFASKVGVPTRTRTGDGQIVRRSVKDVLADCLLKHVCITSPISVHTRKRSRADQKTLVDFTGDAGQARVGADEPARVRKSLCSSDTHAVVSTSSCADAVVSSVCGAQMHEHSCRGNVQSASASVGTCTAVSPLKTEKRSRSDKLIKAPVSDSANGSTLPVRPDYILTEAGLNRGNETNSRRKLEFGNCGLREEELVRISADSTKAGPESDSLSELLLSPVLDKMTPEEKLKQMLQCWQMLEDRRLCLEQARLVQAAKEMFRSDDVAGHSSSI